MLQKKYDRIYFIHFIFCIFIGLYGVITTSPSELLLGLRKIVLRDGILLTDYMNVGGLGATLVNSCITTLLILYLYKLNKTKPNGSMIASIWIIIGFSMIGKNFINIWPTILGVYIYSKIQDEPFSNYILIAILSTSLAPISIGIFNILNFNIYLKIVLSFVISVSLGLFLPPLAKFTLKVHQGYNLYNVGFANGLISIILISILKFFGLELKTRFLWSTEYKLQLIILLLVIFITLIILGINRCSKINLGKILKHNGRSVTDYYLLYKDTAFLNMGILGLLLLGYLLVIKADINGPIIAALLGIVGFGALGKHAFNITPIMIGVILASILNGSSLLTPSILLASMGCATLAPIAGQFGSIAGIFAGFIHLTLIINIGHLSAGANLYNNGFIGGVVAMILVPIIDGLKKGD